VPNNTAAGLVRLFKELRAASVAYGFKHFQISLVRRPLAHICAACR
jgi:hypothetical protein